MKTVRIGNGCGFWGDNLDAPVALAEQGRLDYLTLEYLAELTMSILALQKQRDASAGYATDFLDVLERLAPVLRRQPNLAEVNFWAPSAATFQTPVPPMPRCCLSTSGVPESRSRSGKRSRNSAAVR